MGCGWYVIRLLKEQVLPLNGPLTLRIAPRSDVAQI